ncbi:hypothetical protein Q2T94_07650 [Paeniglutamicibacter sulfureus]|jgi:hypothetical protein|uniref:hypothetical protein n=1 Tax=Paeniglutamicibacter sulfureus TaxID=43666 RepID=UPI0026654A5B|nr:hypothetical protein [Paeniglutamicibacter sulfureus]MDO2934169.1 hypothetical protein [Paeniglutamicibacter sulfureus]
MSTQFDLSPVRGAITGEGPSASDLRCPVDHLEPALERLVNAVNHPDHQGEALARKDYVLLLLTTIVLPALLVVVGKSL